MDSIYENSAFILSTVASSEESATYKDKSSKKTESKDASSKCTKVLLFVLGFLLAISLGGLWAVWTLFNDALDDLDSLEEQLAAQELNSTSLINALMTDLEELQTNCTRVEEHHLIHVAMKDEFNDLTSRYKTLRDWLSFDDAQSCNLTLNGWIACRGKLYLFISDKFNWSSSRDACVSKGADLVTITNRSEQDFLVSKIKETRWIGLNDLDTEGRWVWVNNQTLNETGVEFWFSKGQKEPDNWRNQDPSGENCASLGDSNGHFDSWFDASCKSKKSFICEKTY